MHPHGACYAYTPLSLCSQLSVSSQEAFECREDRNQASSFAFLRIELRVIRIIQ